MGNEKEKIIDFLIEAHKLKDVKRTGWLFLKIKYPESVAAHVYTHSLMAMILADKLKVSRQKLMEMILIHDLCEVYAGDIATRRDGSMYIVNRKGKVMEFKGDKEKREDGAMKKILKKLPPRLRNRYYKLWKEFLRKKTRESRVAHELDKLDYAIQAILYKKRAKNKNDKRIDNFVYVERFLESNYLKHLQKIIRKRFLK